jgi:hypothetical protein
LGDFYPKSSFAIHPDNPLKKSEFDWLHKNHEDNRFKDIFVKASAKYFLVHIPSFTDCLVDRRGSSFLLNLHDAVWRPIWINRAQIVVFAVYTDITQLTY